MNRCEQFDSLEMTAYLKAAFATGLPGRLAQRIMAHSLAYGRHHGPIPDDARQAAVLVVLHQTSVGWSIPAIVRPETMKTHAGQVSLPGGMIETGETPPQTALREFAEELGAPPSGLEVLGPLTPVYVFVSGFEVTPIVAVSPHLLVFAPNPHEVAAVVELPLNQICDPSRRGRHTIERRGLSFSVPHFAIAGQQVWGATSLILAEFVALLTGQLRAQQPVALPTARTNPTPKSIATVPRPGIE
jgi:8-oxo-dGTP pyrophosphatase MutT (NUDIX family)